MNRVGVGRERSVNRDVRGSSGVWLEWRWGRGRDGWMDGRK